MKKIVVTLLFSLGVLAVIFAYQWGRTSDKNLHLVLCDVGQGDAIYIRTPDGADILVDGGPGTKVLDCLSANMPFWDRELELVFATHPDADHITGLVAVLKNYTVKTFGTVDVEKDTKIYEEMTGLIKEQGIDYKLLTAGDNFHLSDGVSLTTLWPEKDYEDADANNHSLVQVLSYGELDVLLTGDISYQILNTLPIDGDDIEIFKLPHHGSKTGVDKTTVAKIRAKIALISAGADNPYHHPHPSVISLLRANQVPYRLTSDTGSIEIISNGQDVKVVD